MRAGARSPRRLLGEATAVGMTKEEYKLAVKSLRQKTMREFQEKHPELTWTEIETVFASYDASRRYTSDTEH